MHGKKKKKKSTEVSRIQRGTLPLFLTVQVAATQRHVNFITSLESQWFHKK